MAKKDKEQKTKEKSSDEGKKIEWNPSDGLDWRDFLGVFILIGQFFWKLIRLIFAPAFWIYGENIRLFRFARAKGHERILTEDERWFVETVPMIYTLTGLIGGLLVGFFAALELQDDIIDFFRNISVDFLSFFQLIGSIIGTIFDAIVWVIVRIGEFFGGLINLIVEAFRINVFFALTGLLILGFLVVVIYIALTEQGFLQKVFDKIKQAFYFLVGSPERFRLRVNSFYRRLNHKLLVLLIGKERIHTRTQVYFKRVVFFSFLLSIYSLIAGITLGVSDEYRDGLTDFWIEVIYIAVVLLFAGVISGTIFFAFVARLLDLFSRKKYIAPEFIVGDEIDKAAIDKFIEEDEAKIQERLKVPDELPKKAEPEEVKKE